MRRKYYRERIRPVDFEKRYEKVVIIKRVTKVVAGGRRFRFSALVVVGDGKGIVGYGLGKGKEVITAINKASQEARKNLIRVPILHGTVPHDVEKKFGATKVLIKPAAPGTGIIAGHAMRAVLEAAGYENLICKVIGSSNPHNVVRATFEALMELKDPYTIAQYRGISLEKLFNG